MLFCNNFDIIAIMSYQVTESKTFKFLVGKLEDGVKNGVAVKLRLSFSMCDTDTQ